MFSISTRSAISALRSTLLLGTVAITCPAFAQKAAPAASTNTQAGEVEEIVVTAQKREQSLQNVPVSVSVLSAATIQANRIQSVTDLSAAAPNLTVRLSAGGAQIPFYTLRGIYTYGGGLGTDKGVGLYIDGVYIQAVAGSVYDLADIQRIEVLKGPQGTLFGRNATGGAISITTKDPTGVLGGYQQFTYGNYDQFRSKTHVDLPQFGPFSASITYLHSQRRGDIRNLGAGSKIDFGPASGGAVGVLTSPKYLGDDNTNGVNAALKLDVNPDISLVYKFDYTNGHLTPNGSGVAFLLPGNNLFTGFYASSTNPKTPISSERPDAINNSFSFPTFNRVTGHNLTAKWHASDQLSFKDILAFRSSYTTSYYQLDGLGGLTVPIGPGVTAPFGIYTNVSKDEDSQWSNEFQANFSNKWLNLTAGYLHFHSYQDTGGFSNTYNVAAFLTYAGQGTSQAGTPGVAPSNPGYVPGQVRVNSDALFIQPEIHLTSRLDIVGGARITSDRKDGFEPYPIQPAPNTPIRYRDRGEKTYLAGINYHPTDDILTYVKYSNGYISGGQLATITFKPERAYSFEGGLKTEFFERRLRSNLAIFDVKYKNVQTVTSGSLTGVASAAPYASAVVSAGDARAKGFEWENTLVPMKGLTLTANFGYTDFHFISGTIFPGFSFVSGAPGYQVSDRPKWTGTMSAQYETPEVLRGGHLMFRLDANFKSRDLLSTDIAPGAGPTAQANQALVNAITVPFSWIVNGRVALTNVEVGPSKLEVAAWSRNMFNNRHLTQVVDLDFGPPSGLVASAIYEQARTFGLDVTLNF